MYHWRLEIRKFQRDLNQYQGSALYKREWWRLVLYLKRANTIQKVGIEKVISDPKFSNT